MSSLLRRVEKLEHQSSDIGAMIWQDLNESREQALERYERTHPEVLKSAERIMVLSWIRSDEGTGA